MKKEFKVISQIIKNNKRVLDIGCGDGTLMEYLKKNQKNDVRGLEPKKDLVQKGSFAPIMHLMVGTFIVGVCIENKAHYARHPPGSHGDHH